MRLNSSQVIDYEGLEHFARVKHAHRMSQVVVASNLTELTYAKRKYERQETQLKVNQILWKEQSV
jgi:hypothetical protein